MNSITHNERNVECGVNNHVIYGLFNSICDPHFKYKRIVQNKGDLLYIIARFFNADLDDCLLYN